MHSLPAALRRGSPPTEVAPPPATPAPAAPPVSPALLTPSPTIREHLSISQLGMYLRCSMQYYFRYVLGLSERPSLKQLNGTAGHTAVEYNYRKKITTKVDEPVDKILDIFSDAYDAETAVLEPTDLMPNDNVGDMKDATVETLKVWRMTEAAKHVPIDVETEFELIVPTDESFQLHIPKIVGRIDLIEIGGTIDNKFTSRMKSQGEVDLSDQLTTYDASLAQKGVSLPGVGLTVFTPPGKTVPGQARTIWRDPKLMLPDARAARHERVFYKFRTAWRGILAGIFLPTDDPRTCGWCGFRDRCQNSLVKDDYQALEARQESR
jgi:RecB family exonuclease